MTNGTSHEELYQLMAAQLHADGFHDAARAVCRSTMCTSSPLDSNENKLSELVSLGKLGDALGHAKYVAECAISEETTNRLGWGSKTKARDTVEDFVPFIPKYVTDERSTRFCEQFTATHKSTACSVCYSPEGEYCASGYIDGTIHVHDVDAIHSRALYPTIQGQEIKTLCRVFTDHLQPVLALQFHPTQPVLLSGGRDGLIHIFDYTRPQSRKAVSVIKDNFPVRCLAAHPDGKYLFYGTDHPVVRIHDLETSATLTSAVSESDAHQHTVWDLALHPDGDLFATGSADGTLKVWDGASAELTHNNTQAHSGVDVTSVRFSRTGNYLLSAGRDNRCILWDLRKFCTAVRTYGTPQQLNALQRPTARFLFRENVIVTNADAENCVVIGYDVHSEQQLCRLIHPSTARSLEASPTQQSLMTGCDDCVLRLWGCAI